MPLSSHYTALLQQASPAVVSASSIWDSRLLWDLRVKRSDPTPPCNPIEYPSNTTEAAPENPSGHNSSLPVASYGGSRRPFFPLGMPLGPRPLCPVARTARPCALKQKKSKLVQHEAFCAMIMHIDDDDAVWRLIVRFLR